MPLDFPASPITGATYTGPNGVIWVWDGAKWVNGTTIGTAYAPIQSPVFTGNPTAPNPPSGDADTSVATTAFVASAMTTVYTNVGRNLIHNPLFAVTQRGAGPFNTTGVYTLDRWKLDFSLDASSVVPTALTDTQRAQIGDEAATNSMAVIAGGNAGAAAFTVVSQYIEDVRRLAGKTVTVSFWAYATSGTPKIGVAAQQRMGGGGSPSPNVDINGTPVTLNTVATRYSVTFSYPSIAGKTLGTNNDHASRLALFFSSGATTNTFAGGIGVQNATFVVWGVQLEIGSVATPLEKPDPRYDQSNCQRFYQWGSFSLFAGGVAANTYGVTFAFSCPMRAIPTVTPNGAPSLANLPSLTYAATAQGVFIYGVATATGTTGMQGNFIASADL